MRSVNKAIAKAGFKVGIAYRLHYFVNLAAVPVNVLISYFLWKAIFAYSNAEFIRGYSLKEMVTYYVIVMVVGFITWTDVDAWMEHDLLMGNMINPLMKPISYFAWHLWFTIGLNWLGVLVQLIPILGIGAILGLTVPTPIAALLFILSVIIAAALYFIFAFLTGIAAFWLKRIRGLRRGRRVVIAFLSGGLIPLSFFPQKVQEVFTWLPFTYMRFTPVSIYMGKLSTVTAIHGLLIGSAWVLILYLATKALWNYAFKRFTGAGT